MMHYIAMHACTGSGPDLMDMLFLTLSNQTAKRHWILKILRFGLGSARCLEGFLF